ncbi:MAG: cell division protein FtsA, partial [Thermoplasmatales archaeon]|nr:cell division protein FtsA [Thermoplasmatales archaeon]
LSSVLEKTERMAGVPLNSAYVGISGNHINTTTSKGVIAVSRADGEITSADVERVIEASKAVAMPPNREILHIIPKSFIVDGQQGIDDPMGMTGIRLEVEASIITGTVNAIKNLNKCVTQAGLEINELIFSPLATAKVLLSKKQKEMGVMMIDIGAGTTNIIIFEEGKLVHCAVLPVGSMHITNDIAIGLRTSLDVAEKIKVKYASAFTKDIRETEKIDLSDFDPHEENKVAKKYVAEIVEARLTEIFSMIRDELKKNGRDGMLPAGIVFTGNGAKLDGLINFTKDYLRLPAQIGYPLTEISGIVDKLDDPSYTTSVGLMLWGMESGKHSTGGGLNLGKFSSVVDKAKQVFKQFIP